MMHWMTAHLGSQEVLPMLCNGQSRSSQVAAGPGWDTQSEYAYIKHYPKGGQGVLASCMRLVTMTEIAL